jgi:hypothetical protein
MAAKKRKKAGHYQVRMTKAQKERFYDNVIINKVLGGKKALWQARHTSSSVHSVGAGNTADNAIKDLARQMSWAKKATHKKSR